MLSLSSSSTFESLGSQATCFICLDECESQPMICSCRTMSCHPTCQQRLIKCKGDAICNVCCSQYTNVVLRKKRRNCQIADIVGILIVFLSFSGFVILTWLYFLYPTASYLLVEAVFLLFSGLFIFLQVIHQLNITTEEWEVVPSVLQNEVNLKDRCIGDLSSCAISVSGSSGTEPPGF